MVRIGCPTLFSVFGGQSLSTADPATRVIDHDEFVQRAVQEMVDSGQTKSHQPLLHVAPPAAYFGPLGAWTAPWKKLPTTIYATGLQILQAVSSLWSPITSYSVDAAELFQLQAELEKGERTCPTSTESVATLVGYYTKNCATYQEVALLEDILNFRRSIVNITVLLARALLKAGLLQLDEQTILDNRISMVSIDNYTRLLELFPGLSAIREFESADGTIFSMCRSDHLVREYSWSP